MDADRPSAAAGDPDRWPPAVGEVCENSVTAEFASLTRSGAPVTVPTTPYIGARHRTIDISTGLTYPAKAERARRDPRVCLLFADPVGSGINDPVTVLVQGLATVRDTDLQANTDRYIRLSTPKLPAATKGQPRIRPPAHGLVLRSHLDRNHTTPRAAGGRTGISTRQRRSGTPRRERRRPSRTRRRPESSRGPGWIPRRNWRESAGTARDRLLLQDLTVIDANGFPLCLPVTRTELVADGFVIHLGPGAPPFDEGPACLTMHCHTPRSSPVRRTGPSSGASSLDRPRR